MKAFIIKNKKAIIIGGALLAIGIGYWYWNKKKKEKEAVSTAPISPIVAAAQKVATAKATVAAAGNILKK